MFILKTQVTQSRVKGERERVREAVGWREGRARERKRERRGWGGEGESVVKMIFVFSIKIVMV